MATYSKAWGICNKKPPYGVVADLDTGMFLSFFEESTAWEYYLKRKSEFHNGGEDHTVRPIKIVTSQ